MKPEAIFQPVFALVVLTCLVLTRLLWLRIGGMVTKKVAVDQYRFYPPGSDPDASLFTSRNFINLFELPVLFYVVTMMYYVTQRVDPLVVYLAWAYVGFRAVHSLIHITSNYLPARAGVFALSVGVLLTLWARLFILLYSA